MGLQGRAIVPERNTVWKQSSVKLFNYSQRRMSLPLLALPPGTETISSKESNELPA